MGAASRGWVLGLVAAIANGGGAALADEPPVPAGPGAPATARAAEAPDVDADAEEGATPEVSAGVDVWSAYYDRGFLIEAEGFVVQPWVAVDVPLLKCVGAVVDDLRFVGDAWGSLQGGETGLDGAPHAPKAWYEGDVWLGLASHVRERLDVRLDYMGSWSPNGSFERFEEVSIEVSYDDEEAFASRGGRFRGCAPRMLLAFETRGQNDEGQHLGRYLELGVEPRWSCCGEDGPTLDLSLPVRLGLSVGDYYEDEAGDDETFGFVAAGVRLSVGLGRFARGLDDLTAIGTVGGIWLGDHTAEAGDGRRSRFLASFGLEWEL